MSTVKLVAVLLVNMFVNGTLDKNVKNESIKKVEVNYVPHYL